MPLIVMRPNTYAAQIVYPPNTFATTPDGTASTPFMGSTGLVKVGFTGYRPFMTTDVSSSGVKVGVIGVYYFAAPQRETIPVQGSADAGYVPLIVPSQYMVPVQGSADAGYVPFIVPTRVATANVRGAPL